MSALSDRIAAEHVGLVGAEYTYGCSCGSLPKGFQNWASHIAAVTEEAVREQIARELNALAVIARDELRADRRRTRAESYDGGTALAYEAAARIARGDT